MVIKRKSWIRLGLIALVAIISISVFLHFSNNEKNRIRRQFKRLSEAVSLVSDEGLLSQSIKSNRLNDLFTEETTLNIPVHGLSGQYSPNEIARNALAAKNRCEKLSLDFFDTIIEIPEPAQAKVITTARVKGQTHAGDTFNEVRELHCHLKKIKGHWLFNACTIDSIIMR